MASSTAPPVVQTELVTEHKARLRSWKSLTNRINSLTLGSRAPATKTPAVVGTQMTTNTDTVTLFNTPTTTDTDTATLVSTQATISDKELFQAHSLTEKPVLNSSKTDASAISDSSTLIGPENDQVGEKLVNEAAAFVNLDEKIPDNLPALPKPILIPRLCKGSTPPLARVWAPETVDHAVTRHDFITFIDNLNIVSTPPPATILLHVAAVGIAFVPWDGADGIAILTELSAIAIGHAIVMRRSKRFLDKMNADYFHARSLHARLVSTKAMRKAVGIAKDDPLVAPLSEETVGMTPYERCMAQVQMYACELSNDVPEPSAQTQLFARLAAWRVKHDLKAFDKTAKTARKRAWKRQLKGKKIWREGCLERSRIKGLQWLLVQNLDEYEREKAEQMEAKKLKRGFTWKSQMSASSKDEEIKSG